MKKIFMIFAVCVFASTELSFGLQLHRNATLDLYENKYDQQGQCQIRTGTECKNEEEFVHIDGTNYCYEADNDGSDQGCQDSQTICILDTSRRKDGTGITSLNECWTADTGRDDKMKKSESIQLQFCHDHNNTITTTKPWTGPGTGKELVFVAKSSEAPIVDNGDNFAKSIVFIDPVKAKESILCIAYICHNDTNSGYGNPDGSCDTTTELESTGAESVQGTTELESTGSEAGGVPWTAPAPTPSTPNIQHRDTVKPYLDALDAKCKK